MAKIIEIKEVKNKRKEEKLLTVINKFNTMLDHMYAEHREVKLEVIEKGKTN